VAPHKAGENLQGDRTCPLFPIRDRTRFGPLDRNLVARNNFY